jgi:hypothetical protein
LTFFSKHRLLLLSVAFIGALLAAALLAFRNAGVWLAVSNPPPPSVDLLFTFGGDAYRYSFGKKIFKKYPGVFWNISVGYFPVFDTTTLATVARRDAALSGLDTSRIIVNDTCTSTGAEIEVLAALANFALHRQKPRLRDGAGHYDSLWYAQTLKFEQWFRDKNIDTLRIALVSYPYHMRRIRMVALRGLKGMPVKLFMLPTPFCACASQRRSGPRWWRNESDATFVISEYIKIAYYFTIRHHVNIAP